MMALDLLSCPFEPAAHLGEQVGLAACCILDDRYLALQVSAVCPETLVVGEHDDKGSADLAIPAAAIPVDPHGNFFLAAGGQENVCAPKQTGRCLFLTMTFAAKRAVGSDQPRWFAVRR